MRLEPLNSRMLSPGWLLFLDRCTVADQIERLLEADMSRTISSSLTAPSARRILGVLALASVLPSGFGGLRVRAVEPRANQEAVAAGSQNVGPGELAGMVVDTQGKPLEGVEVDAWTWYPGNETRTDARGWFRLKNFDKNGKVEVVFRKQGYTDRKSTRL